MRGPALKKGGNWIRNTFGLYLWCHVYIYYVHTERNISTRRHTNTHTQKHICIHAHFHVQRNIHTCVHTKKHTHIETLSTNIFMFWSTSSSKILIDPFITSWWTLLCLARRLESFPHEFCTRRFPQVATQAQQRVGRQSGWKEDQQVWVWSWRVTQTGEQFNMWRKLINTVPWVLVEWQNLVGVWEISPKDEPDNHNKHMSQNPKSFPLTPFFDILKIMPSDIKYVKDTETTLPYFCLL